MVRVIFGFLFTVALSAQAEVQLDKIKLPSGFKISIYAKGVETARQMVWGKSTLFVGSTNGKVYAISQGGAKVQVVASGLLEPSGVAFHDGNLYVSAISRILRYDKIEDNLDHPPLAKEVYTDFPTSRHHGRKFIAFGPDGKLYVPVGAPCNVCELKDPQGTLGRMSPDGKDFEIIARGIRNTVGFDWDPRNKSLWFSENGRDGLGDDIPSDELNRLNKLGSHFGYPYCHAGKVLDPLFGKGKDCYKYESPSENLGAHVAPLGLRFYSGTQFPEEYRNQIFIAEHGSWDRSSPIGYRVSLVRLDKQRRFASRSVFAEGWLQAGDAWGRPADVLVAKDGSLLVADDFAGVIYKIAYK